MPTNFADRLMAAIHQKNAAACVGLDPSIERLPQEILKDAGIGSSNAGAVGSDVPDRVVADALLAFGQEIIRLTAPHVPALKINIAFFERYHADGVRVYFELVRQAREAGMVVIGDVKRADIGHSSAQYAIAQLVESSASAAPDAITINPYFGLDGVKPFIDVAKEQGRGLFILVQTSNASAAQVQGLELAEGGTLCQKVGTLVEEWAGGEGLVGSCGYSSIGAVVSPRDIPSTECIRTLMPRCLFLVPGFGAQGRTNEEVARCFKPDGTGALVTASRSVIYAYQDAGDPGSTKADWRGCIEQGCRDLVSAIRDVTSA